MKLSITTVFLALGLGAALAAPPAAITPEYYNYGLLTTSPTVDAVSFFNSGSLIIDAVVSSSPTNLIAGLFLNGFNPLPFATKDTLYFTNTVSGIMEAYPGFQFDTASSSSRRSASSFVNQGTIMGLDVPALAGDGLYSPPGSTSIDTTPALAKGVPSLVLVYVTNILNTGAMSVGNNGTLSLVGNNVSTAFGALSAGIAGTVGLSNYVNDLTGVQGQEGSDIFEGGPYFYVPSTGVYDLFWGITNGLTVDTSAFPGGTTVDNVTEASVIYAIPSIFGGERSFNDIGISVPFNANPQFTTNAYLLRDGTNIYYDVVFINTNFANTNISATVGLGTEVFLQYASATVPADGIAFENIVQIAEPFHDVITGQTETNGIYLIDDGGLLPSYTLSLDAADAGPYHRPNAFSVTTVSPIGWADAVLLAEEETYPYYDGLLFYPIGADGVTLFYTGAKQSLEIADYGFQVGHNPEDYFGQFKTLAETNSDAFILLDELPVNVPDPTNGPARIQINAQNLNVSQARMRAEGMVQLVASNLIGGGMSGVDWGEASATLGVNSGALVISNIFPQTFQRIRGDVYAKSATWQNTQTNSFELHNGDIFFATNTWHFHVLVVDQNVFGSFTPTVRNLSLTGSNAVVVQDNLNVIGSALIKTTNLTLESSNFFGQNAENFTPATTPLLKNLFINTNASLGTGNLLDIGFNQNKGLAAPGGRTYTVNSITNFGKMFSIAPLLQAAIFEHDGNLTASSGGSILIEASNLSMGLVLTNVTNSLIADGSIDLSAVTIQVRNSVISNGLAEPAALTLTATAQLTDFVSGAPSTNTNSVIVNYWTVTDGFSLPVKPVMGDLYGTQIHTIATANQYVTHTWAATDWSNNIAKGFTDNEVIGRLVLDRTTNTATLHFSAAGVKNAMYVDYLELTNAAFSDYRTGLSIDPNLTIYFADSNIDPQKLQEIYPNLVWVTNFVGPNSVQVVPYTNSSIVCLMNAAVANSGEIAFWDSIPNYNFLQMYGPYLLNGPYGTNFMDCPGTYSYPCNCTPGTNSYQLIYTNGSPAGGASNLIVLTVSSEGQGTISPVLTASGLSLSNIYTFTATPAAGWVFDSWTTVVNTNPVTSYSNRLTFQFVTNTVVTATFIPIPFKTLAGAYNGLFYQTNTNGVEPGSSGSVSLTLTKSGGISGKLLIGSTNYHFTSEFSGAGIAQFNATSGAQSLSVSLQLDVTNQTTGQIFGEVSNSKWSAVLEANLAPTWTSRNPSPLAGSYTMTLPWTNGTVATPGGDSYGAATVTALGVMTMAGALSDGATFTESAPVSAGGLWPFYVYSASGKDCVLGWVTVSNGLSSASVVWSKGAVKGQVYPAGFTNQLQMFGSTWVPPIKNSAVLSLTNPAVMLSGGNLAAPLSLPAASKSSLTFVGPQTDVSIRSSSGIFTGYFDNPKTGKQVKISGVVLTNTNSARGFFLGTNESGDAVLESQ